MESGTSVAWCSAERLERGLQVFFLSSLSQEHVAEFGWTSTQPPSPAAAAIRRVHGWLAPVVERSSRFIGLPASNGCC